MLNKSKTDPELGKKVNDFLRNKGIDTPMKKGETLNSETQKELIEDKFREIMEIMGLDLTDDSLEDTPRRVSKMFIDEIFYGLKDEHFPKATVIENKMGYDEMVIEKNINVQSNCEHHFVVIDGTAAVAYIPNKKVLGLSKLNRIVEYFAKRPQVQERLTEQVYYALSFILDTEDVAVIIDATHYCVKSRGVEDTNSRTITSKVGGCFKEHAVKSEFLRLIGA